MNVDEIICGCLVCNGQCNRKANMRRGDAIGWLSNSEPVNERVQYRKALLKNIQVVDCVIIIKRLKRILNDEENHWYYQSKK